MKVFPEVTGSFVQVTIANPSLDYIAFFVRVSLIDENGDSILPVVWSDNFITIFPEEAVELTGDFSIAGAIKGEPTVIVEYWNDGQKWENTIS